MVLKHTRGSDKTLRSRKQYLKVVLTRCVIPLWLIMLCASQMRASRRSLVHPDSIGASRQEQQQRARGRRDADGCHHVFIDGGANIGVHGRFLLEPEKYPESRVATWIFETQFGKTRDNRDFCIFEIEANPAHNKTLVEKSEAYAALGWRYHVLNVGLSDHDGNMTFYRRNDVRNEEWGFSVRSFFDDAEKVEVPIIRLSRWLIDHVHSRDLPAKVYGNYSKNATVVMKLDIEGSEYVVLPDLISTGALCDVDYLFGEFHSPNAPFDFPGLNINLRTSSSIIEFERALMKTISSFSRTCKVLFRLQDDEAYLHDGMPLPTPGAIP